MPKYIDETDASISWTRSQASWMRRDDSLPWWQRLSELRRCPERLRVLGNVSQALACDDGQRKWIAIVGSRRADEQALTYTYELAQALALEGYVIVSGGALGVDRAAHEGALAVSGDTVCVLAGGLEHASPRSHYELFERIVKGGALLSEESDHAPALKAKFIERNRLIAGLSHATVVIQAPMRSGALSTARVCLKLARPLFVPPQAPWMRQGAGNQYLLSKTSARPLRHADDIILHLRREIESSTPIAETQPSLRRTSKHKEACDKSTGRTVSKPMMDDELSVNVMACLSKSAQSINNLVEALNIPISELQLHLLKMELMGLVREEGVGVFVRIV